MYLGEIRVGKGPNLYEDEFLFFWDISPYEINYVGISTAAGYNGSWQFDTSSTISSKATTDPVHAKF